MSEIKVNKISPKQLCTQLTLGDSGDTIIIPAGATISNQGTAAGFGPTGAVSWDTTAKTSGFTAVSGVGYFCNTTSSAFTVTLPLSPAAGAVVGIADYANTFATNNITVGRNGSNIAGGASNSVLSTNGLAVTFVYVDATQGWIVTDSGNRSDLPQPTFIVATGGTITTCGNYKIHSFTGPGTFTVSSLGNPSGGPNNVDYLVIAGGGGGGDGGTTEAGGGGGAGGYRESVPSPAAWSTSPLASPGGSLPVSATGYPITIGAGGGPAGSSPTGGNGTSVKGSSSVFSTITSTGGGSGVSGGATATQTATNQGGSGGAGNGRALPCGSSGNTPPVSPSQGSNGGTGQPAPANYSGGGGGGATGTGGGASAPSNAGAGGTGATSSISGISTARAGGGGGGTRGNSGNPAPASGGGGAGGTGNGSPGGNGTANTGGGAGGNGGPNSCGGTGGSGIVVIRYKYQ